MINITQVARVGGISGSLLTLFCLLGLIVSGFYMATAKTTDVMARSRKYFYAFFAFFLVGVFLAGTSGGYVAYGM